MRLNATAGKRQNDCNEVVISNAVGGQWLMIQPQALTRGRQPKDRDVMCVGFSDDRWQDSLTGLEASTTGSSGVEMCAPSTS